MANSGFVCFPAGEGDLKSAALGDAARRPLDNGFMGEAVVSSEGKRTEFFGIASGNRGVLLAVERIKIGAEVETPSDRMDCWSSLLTPADERRGNGSGWTPLKAVGAAKARSGQAVRLQVVSCVETDSPDAGPGRRARDGESPYR